VANYVTDHFTDADHTHLSTHLPDVGSAYTIDDNDAEIVSNQLTNVNAGGGFVRANPAPSTADYQVSATFIMGTGGNSIGTYLMLRCDGISFRDGYGGGYDSTNYWVIGVSVGGTFTPLVTASSPTYDDTANHLVVFSAVGTLLSLSVDGTVILTYTDSTYTGVGQAGIEMFSLIEGWLNIDDYSVDDIGGGGGGGGTTVTGAGTLSCSAPTAVEITITPTPTIQDQAIGNPDRYFHLGNVSWGASGFFTRNYFLEHVSERVEAPFAADTLAYSIGIGLTAVLTFI
jgi:hypothetical protein